jgi:hypothetical protein
MNATEMQVRGEQAMIRALALLLLLGCQPSPPSTERLAMLQYLCEVYQRCS